MTTGTNPDPATLLRRRAAEVLEVSEDATAAEARRAFFRHYREQDFAPPSALRHACGVLTGQPIPAAVEAEWRREDEDGLRDEVEAFAAAFFTFAVAQRRERWEALLARCTDTPPLAARLQALQVGLDLDVERLPLGQPFHGELARQVLDTFALPALAQAAARQAFLRRIADPAAAASQRAWEKAARYLLAEWPALAGLDTELLQQVARLRARLKHLGKRASQRHGQGAIAPKAEPAPWTTLINVGFVILIGLVAAAIRSSGILDTPSAPKRPSSVSSPPFNVNQVSVFEQLKTRALTDPNPGSRWPLSGIEGMPSMADLLDPLKYDVQVHGAGGARIVCFTPRPDVTLAGPYLPDTTGGPPLRCGEATLRLMGMSQEQLDLLAVRAAAEERRTRPLKSSTAEKPLR